jgi:hypothetical protein
MKRLAVCAVIGSLVVLSFSARAGAQAPPKPGPEHDKLKEMVGTWEASVKSPAGDSKGTMTYKMELGGLWLVEDFQGDFGGMAFQGRGMTSYDSAKKKYVTVWVDSFTTDVSVLEGTFDKDGKVQTMKGDMAGPDGQKMKVTMITERKDKDNVVTTMLGAGPDGKEMEMMKMTYTRKK